MSSTSARFLSALWSDRQLSVLCLNPALLRLTLEVSSGQVPLSTGVGGVLVDALDQFLDQRNISPEFAVKNRKKFRVETDSILRTSAGKMFEAWVGDKSRGSPEISILELDQVLRLQFAGRPFEERARLAIDYINFFRAHARILVSINPEDVTFAHLPLFCFFLGKWLVEEASDPVDTFTEHEIVRDAIRIWAEAEIHLLRSNNVTMCVAALLASSVPTARVLGAELMTFCPASRVLGAAAFHRKLVEAALTVVDEVTTGVFDLELRVAARFTAWDLRKSDTVETVKRELFIRVPSARHKIGTMRSYEPIISRKHLQLPWRSESTVLIDDFLVYAHPVTNAEFKAFIDAGGYEESRWWESREARLWQQKDAEFMSLLRSNVQSSMTVHFEKELASGSLTERFLAEFVELMLCRNRPLYWLDPLKNRAIQPVVGINIWEAEAFCSWCSETLDIDCGLPTEDQWEAACLGGNLNVDFPWGSNVTPTPAVVRPHALLHAAPVGMFPNDTWTGGPVDMVGNVWEWTSSLANLQSEQSCNAPQDRIVKGGSWFTTETIATNPAFRSFDPPCNAYIDLGFRVFARSR